MRVRAKFQIQSIECYSFPPESGSVKLAAVYSSDNNAEDNSFSQATPSANLQMHVSNPSAFKVFADAFHAKKAIYADFTVAESS
jgi:hypothetical protein